MGIGYTECRVNQTSCKESDMTFHASNENKISYAFPTARLACSGDNLIMTKYERGRGKALAASSDHTSLNGYLAH
jgi:hypothetical protein